MLRRVIPQEDADELYRIYPDLPKSHLHGCPACGKNRGYGIDGVVELDGVQYECNCHDQLQRQKHYLNAGIGATYQYVTWDDYKGDQRAIQAAWAWAQDIESSVESGFGMYFHSRELGVGKTFLATLLLKECVMHGYRSYMTTFQNMLSAMKHGWSDAQYDKWYKGKLESARVLLIDDLGKEMMATGGFNNEYAKQTLDSLLRTRTQQNRPTIFTSNLAPNELGSHYGQAVASLLNENTGVCEVGGSDFRKQVRAQKQGYRRVY